MKKHLLLLLLFLGSLGAYSQEFPLEGKKKRIVYKGNQQGTQKLQHDLKPLVRAWLKESNKNARGFSYSPKDNTFTGTFQTVLKYKDALGVEHRFPMSFTMHIAVVESAILHENTYRYELSDFQILNHKRKPYPAEQLLVKGETDKNDPVPAEHLFAIRTQATSFIDNLLVSFHKKLLDGSTAGL